VHSLSRQLGTRYFVQSKHQSRVRLRTCVIPTVPGSLQRTVWCMELQVGDAAPDFQMPTDQGGQVSLKEFRGRPVVLYFYPKANTP
jgi:hypothetical protein